MKLKDAIQEVKSGVSLDAVAGEILSEAKYVYADGTKMTVPDKVLKTIEAFLRNKQQITKILDPMGDPFSKKQYTVDDILASLMRRGAFVEIAWKRGSGGTGRTVITVPWEGTEIEMD